MAWLAPSPRPSPPMLGEREMTVLSRAFPPSPRLTLPMLGERE
jgi:hypothetical protein